jgi:RimJ/RimL family protein N-acetyltransferase
MVITPRLLIRPFKADDLDAVAALLDACFGPAPRERHAEWLDWAVRNYVALRRLGQPPYGDYAVALRESGEIVGTVGLVPSYGPFERLASFRGRLTGEPSALATPELGLFWATAPAHRRRGYAAEAAAGMARHAFDSLRASRVVATTERDNAASIAVMRRIGMNVDELPDAPAKGWQVAGVLWNPAGGTGRWLERAGGPAP